MSVLPDKLTWKNEYNLGLPEIDEQHKKWVELMGLLFDTLKQQDAAWRKILVSQVIDELFEYSVFHLNFEEEMLKNSSFPLYQEHCDEHDLLRNLAKGYRIKAESDEDVMASQLLVDMQNWLVDHICIHDKKYADFLNSQSG